MSIVKDFKEFAVRGNMLDMAIGIMIGGGFATVVRSLVDDIITPIISGIFRVPDFDQLYVVLSEGGDYATKAEAIDAGAAVLAYGSFLNAMISFAILALVMFGVVKLYNHLMDMAEKMRVEEDQKKEKKQEEKADTEISILKDIRAALTK
jgi:large conductance mechanosensitive channel